MIHLNKKLESFEAEFDLPAGREDPASGVYFCQLKVGYSSSSSGQSFGVTKKIHVVSLLITKR